MYIWQQADWKALQGERTAPAFSWDAAALRPRLDAIRLLQGRLLGQSDLVVDETDQQAQLDALVQTALRTSEIEGETLNVGSVRSSVVRRLGLHKAGFVQGLNDAPGTPQTEALVGLLLEATADTGQPLSIEELCQWQAALFPEPPLLGNIRIGELRGDEPMQVVSGRIDRPVVHFEAPPREGLEAELQCFVDWFNEPPGGLDPILRAGIAHLWLITLHPFDDGNGRVTRAVTDRTLAQAEQSTIRFYSLSAAIMARRNEYYDQLEVAQKGSLDITPWLGWFLSVLEDALHQGLKRFERVVQKARYWQRHSQTVLSERQIKVLNRLLDGQGEEFEHGINASKYMSIAKVSKATATRELGDLLAKGCLHKLPGGGRSTRYAINDTPSKKKAMSTQDIVAKLWNLCNVLRDDGVTYHQYVTELTYLLFLKMAEETDTETDKKTGKERIPAGYRWADLKRHNDADRLEEYKKQLIHLGTHGSRITRMIFANATSVIRKPKTLTTLITEIDKLDWYDAKKEGLGDLYEGLLKKNADEKKSGAGQYFTPRVLIDVIVRLMQPQLGDRICDPAAGTGGFLISAHQYLDDNNDILGLNEKAYERYQHDTFYGMELVPDTHRLAMMNLMLHNLAVDDENAGILFGDTLSSEGTVLKLSTLVLSNPPFGTKQGGGGPTREDLLHYTSNKQLAFLHVIYHRLLANGGRAAIVLPDNVLFEGGIGKTIRRDLMDKCNLHTILRLPTGIFYAQGVKTNVLFFSKPKNPTKDTGNTQHVWVYDLRTNMPQFGKRTLLTQQHFDDFVDCFGSKADGSAKRKQRDDNERWRCFSRDAIAQKDDSLDLSWIKDESSVDAADLPAPEVLAAEAMGELTEALRELDGLLRTLGAEDELAGQRSLLAESMGMEVSE